MSQFEALVGMLRRLVSSVEPDLSAAMPEQTPGQWAVRWHGVVLFVGLAVLSPLLHLGWHGLAGRSEPLIRTNATARAPVWSWGAAADGRFQKQLETWLQEDSPVTWLLRGSYRELLWHLGQLQTDHVHVGKDGWLFARPSLDADPEVVEGRAEKRQALFAAIGAEARRLGVELVVMVVPDKERIYQDFAYESGAMPARKAELYPRLLRELAAAGLLAIDLATALVQARALGGEPVYQLRDSHWSAPGALVAAMTVAGILQQRVGDRLGPAQEPVLVGPHRIDGIEDLAGQLGMLTRYVQRPGLLDPIIVPASLTTHALARPLDYWGVSFPHPSDPARRLGLADLAPDAAIALAGSSFSRAHGDIALAFALRRPIDNRWPRAGADSTPTLRALFDAIARGECQAKVVIWEFVERAAIENLRGPWRASR
ncbi:MAG: hypothetical protein IPK26_12660 [Planctomycetes bacterium]|nr:hypothetical protein [Planctomycetota bacterium]